MYMICKSYTSWDKVSEAIPKANPYPQACASAKGNKGGKSGSEIKAALCRLVAIAQGSGHLYGKSLHIKIPVYLTNRR
jgi:hypothetical protein